MLVEVAHNPHLTKSEKKTLNNQIERRFTEHQETLSDFGYDFQQLYYAVNLGGELSSLTENNPRNLDLMQILDNSVPDRAIVSYIEELTKFRSSMAPTLTESELSVIDSNIEKMKEALKISLMVTLTISNKGSEKKVAQKALTNFITEKMNALKPGEEMMIPAGFMRGSTKDILNCFLPENDGLPRAFGHSIFVSCKKLESDKLEFKIFNTGFGSDVHAKRDNKILPKHYEANLNTNEVAEFCRQLINCSSLPLSAANPEGSFYECFSKFTPIQSSFLLDLHENSTPSTEQAVNSCTQFSVRAYLKEQMGNNPELFNKFNEFMIEDGIRKCESFLDKTEVNATKAYFYKHPGLTLHNKLHFFLILVLSKLLFNTKIKLKSGNIAFEVKRTQLDGFVKKVKSVREAKAQAASPLDLYGEDYRRQLEKLGLRALGQNAQHSLLRYL